MTVYRSLLNLILETLSEVFSERYAFNRKAYFLPWFDDTPVSRPDYFKRDFRRWYQDEFVPKRTRWRDTLHRRDQDVTKADLQVMLQNYEYRMQYECPVLQKGEKHHPNQPYTFEFVEPRHSLSATS